jgi:hypothetical protein
MQTIIGDKSSMNHFFLVKLMVWMSYMIYFHLLGQKLSDNKEKDFLLIFLLSYLHLNNFRF